MAGLTEEEIRNRAYRLWEDAGRPAGQMDNFWYEAEDELIHERKERGDIPSYLPDTAAR